ncbi:MAG: penicillin-binding protein 2 [Caldilineaceae bacterium]|nr:penicillin-binding protein 2 [Caldilineaceae bacterium]
MALIVLLGLLIGRLYQLQVRQHEKHAADADANRLRTIEIPAPRGLIFDRNGELLARNRPSYQLAIVPEELPDDDLDTEADEEYEAILQILESLGPNLDRNAVLDMQRNLHRSLGWLDYRRILVHNKVPFSVFEIPYHEFVDLLIQIGVVDATTGESTPIEEEAAAASMVSLPDLNQPLPIEGLAFLIQNLAQTRQQGNSSEPFPILTGLSREAAFTISEQSFRYPGSRILDVSVREYVYGELASHILGFMGPIPSSLAEAYRERGYRSPAELVGLSGVEAEYQDILRGTPGQRTVEADIFGRVGRTIDEVVPQPGQDIILTVDIQLQRVMYKALQEMLTAQDAISGVAIAVDPRSGQLLGMVSLPSFDNNIFSEGLGETYTRIIEDERRPLINYAIGGLYPPGSTFKIVTASAGMAEGVITPRTVIVDEGPIYLPNRFFPDDPSQAQEFVSWNHHRDFNHGPLTLREAIAVSNDIYFYYVGGGYPQTFIGLTQEALAQWARVFGYGSATGIDLPGEVSFSVPDDQWKRVNWASSWVQGDSYNMAIGQGYLLATPLQVLQSLVPIANGGMLYQPQVALQITNPSTGRTQEFEPRPIRDVGLNRVTLDTIRLGMRDAVNAVEGTATRGQIEGVIVAGKTGTAEFCEYDPALEDCRRDEEGNLPTHASYLAFAPFNNPEIAVMVFVYDGGEGSTAAVPVGTAILDAWFTIKGLGSLETGTG